MPTLTIREKVHHGRVLNFRIGVLPSLDFDAMAHFMAGSYYAPAAPTSDMGKRQVNRTLSALEAGGRAELGWTTYTLHAVPDGALCDWYLFCGNPAVAVAQTRAIDRPVPICQRCADKFEESDQIPVVYFPPTEEDVSVVDIQNKFTLLRDPNGDVMKIESGYEAGLTRNLWAVLEVEASCDHIQIEDGCDECTPAFNVVPGPYTGSEYVLYYIATTEEWTNADKDIKYVF